MGEAFGRAGWLFRRRPALRWPRRGTADGTGRWEPSRRWGPSLMSRVLVLALVWLLALVEPASAHTVVGQRATNFRTTVVAVVPAMRGLEAKSLELGQRFQL